MNSTAVGHTY